MIVRQAGEDLLFITQPDHAHLAAAIMQHSVALTANPRRASILLAVAEHDNGWREADAAPRVDLTSGLPVDFLSAPTAVRQGVWPRGVARLMRDPWAAALVAHHAITVFERYRGDGAWEWFFAELETTRTMMKNASRCSFDALIADYRFVGLGDQISLTFCNGWREERFDEWTVELAGDSVSVSPDPFGGASIPIEIGAKQIRRRVFADDSELQEALDAADAITLHGVVGPRR
jgi:hypothetical protein